MNIFIVSSSNNKPNFVYLFFRKKYMSHTTFTLPMLCSSHSTHIMFFPLFSHYVLPLFSHFVLPTLLTFCSSHSTHILFFPLYSHFVLPTLLTFCSSFHSHFVLPALLTFCSSGVVPSITSPAAHSSPSRK